MNMNTFAIICLFLKLTILNAAATKKTENAENLYDVLVQNCASLNLTDTLFKNQDIIKKCTSWKEINETKLLSDETAGRVLCLLYYESFMSLCTKLKVSKLSNVTVKLVPDVSSYKLEQVCKNRALFPSGKTFEHDLKKMITRDDICGKLCMNYDGNLKEGCALAYYFANYNVTTQSDAISKTNLPKQKLVPPLNQVGEVSNVQNLQANSMPQNARAGTNEIHDTNKEPTQNKDGKPPKPTQIESEKPPTRQEPALASGNVNIVNQPSLSSDSKNSSKPVPNASEVKRVEISGNDKESSVKEPSSNPNLPDNESADNSEKAAGGTGENSQQSTPPKSGGEEENPGKDKDEHTGDHVNPLDQPERSIGGDLEDAENGNIGFSDKDEEGPSDTATVALASSGSEKNEKPSTTLSGDLPVNYNTAEELDGESYFFSYFMVICVLFVLGYVGYHNRQKVMALMLEGKRGRRQVRSRRPNSANYHKLDSNLEEAISSSCTKNSSHVIY